MTLVFSRQLLAPMKQQGKQGPPPALTGAGRASLSHTSLARGHRQACKSSYNSSRTVCRQAQHPWHQLDPKMHCLQNPPLITPSNPKGCCSSPLPLNRRFVKGLLLPQTVCADFSDGCSWKSGFHSHSPHLFSVRKQSSHFLSFFPLYAKEKDEEARISG